ncbi:NADP-dependent oxidoreductase domain-containing protein 1 [Rhineura floridana]|uniref:NADP-dependent oxidoreductase domain-containing protein 1 n=1 Tax=Rhineura floridana TaxID=261503 RepID=UPI002AC89353|nr:NADP-dependent oxidoreductase domain-containing protein 1 [Rhineura floridana]
MDDIMVNLKTFHPEYRAGTNEPLMSLRCRAKGLTVNACAHALFFCKLLQATRKKEESCAGTPACTLASPPGSKGSQSLNIGIIGGGHIGKQLVRTLQHLGGISGKNIQISTRRPETLSEFQMLGVDCFYNNRKLVSWADAVFLCCLPSHLPQICSEVQDALKKCSIVYSLVTAIPLPRLKQLLSCNAILRPQYKFTESGLFQMWEASRTVVEALKDPAVIQATCPCSPKEEIVVNVKWLAAVFYAALNSYTRQHLPYMRALLFLNQVCFLEDAAPASVEDKSESPVLVCENFINPAFASSLTNTDTFPWFDLTTVQLKDSPLSQLLATSTSFQNSIASLYCKMIAALPTEESMKITLKTSLSAVLLDPTKTLIHGMDRTCVSKVEEGSSTDSESEET